jgi:hypothetical protein
MVEQQRSPAAVQEDAAKLNAGAAPGKSNEAYPMMRQLGGRAYQLLAAARAADHFIAQESVEDRDTGSWLIACAVGLADELAADLDGMARNIKASAASASDALVSQGFQKLRARAHQLHAATRAADHFLEQDNNVDRSTGSWLIACALGLADKLANELEDLANGMRRAPGEAAMPPVDPGFSRRGATVPPLRAATV